jgi:hypothetical protein
VWLPLPHLLNAVPVQFDPFYRSGASAIALSVLAHALAAGALTRLAWQLTCSRAAALVSALLFTLNPSALYLQATPMTEPLLLGLLALGMTMLVDAAQRPRQASCTAAGLALAAACLTRYEAWPVTVLALAVAAAVAWRRHRSPAAGSAVLIGAGIWPALAIAAFLINSKLSAGAWLVTSGFFAAVNQAQGRPLAVLAQVVESAGQVVGPALMAIGVTGWLVALARTATGRAAAATLVPLTLGAAIVVSAWAAYQGHPMWPRYAVVLLPWLALGAGVLVGALPRRVRGVTAAAVLAVVLIQMPPHTRTQVVYEGMWDLPTAAARAPMAACLRAHFTRPHDKVLASLGALAPFVHELAKDGFRVSDFVHEGTGGLWTEALAAPQRHVEWLLMSRGPARTAPPARTPVRAAQAGAEAGDAGESARVGTAGETTVVPLAPATQVPSARPVAAPGDPILAHRLADPMFLDGFVLTCEAGDLVAYRRDVRREPPVVKLFAARQ